MSKMILRCLLAFSFRARTPAPPSFSGQEAGSCAWARDAGKSVPRQQRLHQVDRPDLEGLWQDRVVGVRKRSRHNLPALVPLEAL